MAKKFVQYNGMLIFSKIDLIGSLTLVKYKVRELFDKIGFILGKWYLQNMSIFRQGF